MPSLVPRLFIRHLRNEKGTVAEMCPAILCGIVAGWGRGAAPISYWQKSLQNVTRPSFLLVFKVANGPFRGCMRDWADVVSNCTM